MENKRNFNKFLSQSFDDMKGIVDSSRILGDPIFISSDEVIIPISKLTFGFGIGGSEFGTANKEIENDLLFETSEDLPYGGGSLGGLFINPEAFLYIKKGEAKVIKMAESPSIYERLIEFYKDVIRPMRKK